MKELAGFESTMPQTHIPNLKAIAKLVDDPQTRFYAIVGAAVSLSAALEIMMLDIYAMGTNSSPKAAAPSFYSARFGAARRNVAIKAMGQRLADDPLLSDWQALSRRIETVTGATGLRHLISHNQVVMFETDGTVGGAPLGAIAVAGDGEEEFYVFEDHQKVLAGHKLPQQADFYSLLTYSRELINLLRDLRAFLARIP